MLQIHPFEFKGNKFNSTYFCKSLRSASHGTGAWYVEVKDIPWVVTSYFCSVALPDTTLARQINNEQRFTPEGGRAYRLHTKASVLLPELTDEPPKFESLLQTCVDSAKEEALPLRFGKDLVLVKHSGYEAYLFSIGGTTVAFNKDYLEFIVSAETPQSTYDSNKELVLMGNPDPNKLRPFTLWRRDELRGIIMPVKLPDDTGPTLRTIQ